MKSYLSRRHPGGRPRPIVFASELVRPLGVCMLPVMVVTLVAMLEGQEVLAAIYTGFPLALLVASAWTWIRTRDIIVEIHVDDDRIAVRSLYDAAAPEKELHWSRLLDARREGGRITLQIGHEEFRLEDRDWDLLPVSLP